MMKKPKSILEGFSYPVKYKRVPSLNDSVVFVVLKKGEKV